MPGAAKRTRQATEDENASPLAPNAGQPQAHAPPTPSSSRPTTRRALQTSSPTPRDTTTANDARATSARTPATTPSLGTASPRPPLTRSATMLAPPTPNTPLSRSSSTFGPSRRGNGADAGNGATLGSAMRSGFGGSGYGLGLGTPSSSSSSTAGPITRGSMLLRTQSTPALMGSLSELKSLVAPGGSGGGRDKGDPDDVFGSSGPRRFGKGKENIPPKKDGEESQRSKRLRIGSGSGRAGGRGRSGSVASVRSESSSGGPSLFSRRSSAFPTPSPSPSSATSQSSVDPLDIIDDETDVERTPTKARPLRARRDAFPTPPSSSPFSTPALRAEVDATRKRMALVHMDSSSSIASLASFGSSAADDEAEATETEADPPSSPLKPKNAYKHLKTFLRLCSTSDRATPAEIIGREEEKDALRAYFSTRSTMDVGMYVSGPPGTGKTALVTAMGREMGGQGYKVVELGCMGLKVGDVWRRLGEGLGCGQSENEVAAHMATTNGDVLIVLDEVDSLLPAAPALPNAATSHLLSKLFAFPLLSTADRTIKLIAISNTLDLTVRAGLVLPNGAQPTVLPFKAYNSHDMASIITTRLDVAASTAGLADPVRVDTKAVELLTRKVEAQNGDLRMCLASLASAVNLAETEWVKKTFASELDVGGAEVPLIKVSLSHVIKAFSSHTQQLKAAAGSAASTAATSPTTRKIRSVPLQGKMVLVSILVYLSRVRAGLPGVPTASAGTSPASTPHKHGDLTTSTLYAAYSAILSNEGSPFPPAAESDYRDLLSNLETLGLVSLHGSFSFGMGMSRSASTATLARAAKSAGGGGPRVELCVRDEEVRAGLGLGGGVGEGKERGSADEEVGKVWAREESKVEKQREKVARAVEALKAVAEQQE